MYNSQSLIYNNLPYIAKLLGLKINQLNFGYKLVALGDAIQHNDIQGILTNAIDLAGATAGIIGSIPGMPPNISIPAKAINPLATSGSMLLADPTVWQQLRYFGDTLEDLFNSPDAWKLGMGEWGDAGLNHIITDYFNALQS